MPPALQINPNKTQSTPPNSFNPAGWDVVAWWILGEAVGRWVDELFTRRVVSTADQRNTCDLDVL